MTGEDEGIGLGGLSSELARVTMSDVTKINPLHAVNGLNPADVLRHCILTERRALWEAEQLAKMRASGKEPKDDKWKARYEEPTAPDQNVLHELPLCWTWVTIEQIAFVTKLAGFEFTKYVTYIPDGDLPVIKAENVSKRGFVRKDFSFVDSQSVSTLVRSKLRGGEILMNFVGSVGNVARVPYGQDYFLGPNVAMIKIQSNFVLPEYLEFALLSEMGQKQVSARAQATTQSSISMGQIRLICIPLPPPAEQKRIGEEIDRLFSLLDAGVANLKRVQANLKRYRASVLQAACTGKLVPTEHDLAHAEGRSYEPANDLLTRILAERRARWEGEQLAKMRAAGKEPKDDKWKARYEEPVAPDTGDLPELPQGWEWASIQQTSTKVVDGVHKKPNYVDKGVPFVTVRNMTAGAGISFERLNYITEDDHAEFIKRADPEEGDILVSKDGTLGVIRLVNTDRIFSIFVSVALVKPVERSMGRYFATALSSPVVQKQMVGKGSGLQHIHLEDLRSDCVPLPPLAEQERIVAEVERRLSVVEALETTVAQNLKRAERLRQSILRDAFSGKLVPQDPTDEPASLLLERIRSEAEAVTKNGKGASRRKAQLTLPETKLA